MPYQSRDIFAPVAAHLEKGLALARVGKPLVEPVTGDFAKPSELPDGRWRGTVLSIDHFGNVIGTFYIRRIGTEGAKYGLKVWNKTIKTYDNVSQFWDWPEQEFLAHPVYSRDYPPLDKC